MPDETQPIHKLSYHAIGPPRIERAREWLSRWPLWGIALVMIVPVVVVGEFHIEDWLGNDMVSRIGWRVLGYAYIAAMFLPRELRSLSWRRGAVVAALAAVVYVLDLTNWQGSIVFPYTMLTWYVPLVGVGDWAVNGPRKPRTLVWTLVLMLAVVALLASVCQPLRFANWTIRRAISHPGGTTIYTFDFAWPSRSALQAVLIWLAIPAAQRLADTRNRFAAWVAVFSTMACAAWFAIFFHIVVYRLAARSLAKGWPFDRDYAVSILQLRDDKADEIVFWQAVERADWSSPPDDLRWHYPGRCIKILAERDPAVTAERLSVLLRGRPSSALAECAAPILAQQHHYETAPELMRYALLGNNDCLEALDSMRVPQAALAVIAESERYRRPRSGTDPNELSLASEKELADLLGEDVGPKISDWNNLYDRVISQRLTPLSVDQASETDRVSRALAMYWDAQVHLLFAGRLSSVPKPNLDVPTTAGLEQEIRKYCAAATSATAPSSMPASKPSAP